MSCPTCSHTMHAVVPRVFWCPRCGTLKTEEPNPAYVETPTLIVRLRKFRDLEVISNAGPSLTWHTLGVAEIVDGDLPNAASG